MGKGETKSGSDGTIGEMLIGLVTFALHILDS